MGHEQRLLAQSHWGFYDKSLFTHSSYSADAARVRLLALRAATAVRELTWAPRRCNVRPRGLPRSTHRRESPGDTGSIKLSGSLQLFLPRTLTSKASLIDFPQFVEAMNCNFFNPLPLPEGPSFRLRLGNSAERDQCPQRLLYPTSHPRDTRIWLFNLGTRSIESIITYDRES